MFAEDKQVGFFTISFEKIELRKSRIKEKEEFSKLHKSNGGYTTLFVNFLALHKDFQGKYIENKKIKYSDLLMYDLFAKALSILDNIPFTFVALEALEGTQKFYEKFKFEHIQDSSKGKPIYILPVNLIKHMLDEDDEKSPFYELLTNILTD